MIIVQSALSSHARSRVTNPAEGSHAPHGVLLTPSGWTGAALLSLRTHIVRLWVMRLGPTLLRAVSGFVIATVTFAAAMVIAHSLSIPDPAGRFLPGNDRELPDREASTAPADGLTLTGDDASALAQSSDEPVTEVTAVPVPPSSDDTVVAGGPNAAETAGPDAAAVSSSRDSVATAQNDPADAGVTESSGSAPATSEPPAANRWTWPVQRRPSPSTTPSEEPPPSESESERGPVPKASESTEPPDPEPSEPPESASDVQSDPTEVATEPTEPASSAVPSKLPVP